MADKLLAFERVEMEMESKFVRHMNNGNFWLFPLWRKCFSIPFQGKKKLYLNIEIINFWISKNFGAQDDKILYVFLQLIGIG